MSIAVSLNYSPDRRSPLRRSSFRRSGVSRGVSRRSPCRLSPWRRSPLRRSSLGCSLLNCIPPQPPGCLLVFKRPYQKMSFPIIVLCRPVIWASQLYAVDLNFLMRLWIDVASLKNHIRTNNQVWRVMHCTTMKRSRWMCAVLRTG